MLLLERPENIFFLSIDKSGGLYPVYFLVIIDDLTVAL